MGGLTVAVKVGSSCELGGFEVLPVVYVRNTIQVELYPLSDEIAQNYRTRSARAEQMGTRPSILSHG